MNDESSAVRSGPTESDATESAAAAVFERVASVLRRLLGESAAGHLEAVVGDALGTRRFLDDLAEIYRLDPERVAQVLAAAGFRPAVGATPDRPGAAPGPEAARDPEAAGGWVAAPEVREGPGFRVRAAGPAFDRAFADAGGLAAGLDAEWERAASRIALPDPFLSFYRTGILEYLDHYAREVSPPIREFVTERFGAGGPRYLITVGIGANEQFWHFPQRWHQRQDPSIEWIVADNPKDLWALPSEATVANTLVLEASRSGKTQETVKLDEFLDPAVPKVVLANTGPLRALAERSDALIVELPDEIPGRFSKNLSPILLAPLDILDLPYDRYWRRIAECVDRWDLLDPSSPPVALARYLRGAQILHGANHIYLGSNDEMLLASCDELVQFWNEGVNKGSDYSMSRYFGLPRDSHLNIEGILANHATKAGVFVLRRASGASGAVADAAQAHDLIVPIRPINEEHLGLTIDDVDYALARANADHFGTRMPTVTIEVDEPDLMTSAVLSQLWTDTAYVYSAMIGVNPGSNPEVRQVRDRSDAVLVETARARRR